MVEQSEEGEGVEGGWGRRLETRGLKWQHTNIMSVTTSGRCEITVLNQ